MLGLGVASDTIMSKGETEAQRGDDTSLGSQSRLPVQCQVGEGTVGGRGARTVRSTG